MWAESRGRDTPEIVDVEAVLPGRAGEDLLDHEGVDTEERKLLPTVDLLP